MKALGLKPGDEVIIQANAYIADVMAITNNGLTPIFVEIDNNYCIDIKKIEEKLTERTKALLLVHLYGNVVDIDEVDRICKKHDLLLIEDCAQAHGAKYKNQITGSFGKIACFSFYPTKNLGAFGDAGAILTNDKILDNKIRMYRNYGSINKNHNEIVGVNSRMDEIQAGLLRVKLSHLDELNFERKKLAGRYDARINNSKLVLPTVLKDVSCVWHQYVIRCKNRNDLIRHLNNHKIGYDIHYPEPAYLSKAYSYLGIKEGTFPKTERFSKMILSLPLYIGMKQEEQDEVINALNSF